MSGTSSPQAARLDALNSRFAEIQTLLSSGRAAEALPLAESLFGIAQARVGAQALAALAAALAGLGDKAREHLAGLPGPEEIKSADVALAAGSALFKLGDLGGAIRFLQAAQSRNPDHPLVQARLGGAFLAGGRVAEALPHLERAAQLMPRSGGAAVNLAQALLALNRPEEALAALEQVADSPDRDHEIQAIAHAEVLAALGRQDEAEQVLRDDAAAGNAKAAAAAVSLLAASGKHDEAHHCLVENLEKFPRDLALLEMAADLAQTRGRHGEATRYFRLALEVEPENAELWGRLATFSSRHLDAGNGRAAADKAMALTAGQSGVPRAQALAAHAHVLQDEDDLAGAEAAYRQALEAFPGSAGALNGLGNLLMQLGRVEEATELFEQLKTRSPVQGWSQLIHARQVPEDPAVLERMEEAARRPSLEGPVSAHLLFTLASAWEKKQQFDKAFQLAREANEATKAHLRYDPQAHRSRVEREMARFSGEFMDSRRDFGVPSQLPVFILGMPRSGTTLVEQILGSHSRVFGAGELSIIPELIQKLSAWENKLGSRREYPECVDDLSAPEARRFAEKMLAELQAYAPAASRVVDKLPHNFEHVGLIKLLFPNAAILHLKREPRDVAMSNYFVNYAAKFGGMGFAYDLEWIGGQLVDHQRLMDHWHAVFPGQILEVDYDALVEDVEGWAHRIIAYLGLEWEPGVLDFQKLDRAVKTASVWQVRQPVYTTSKAKWKRYESHLQPLEAALARKPVAPAPLPMPELPPGLFPESMEHLQAGRGKEAEAGFRRLLAQRPDHAAAHHFLGAALFQQGRAAEAATEMQRSLALLPVHRQWLENLIAVEEALGNTEEAATLRQRLAARRQASQPESSSLGGGE